MAQKPHLRGVIPVTVVPMHHDGNPDVEGIHRHVDFLVKAGAGGLWVLGSASEDINMSTPQRITVARETSKAAAGRIPLVVGSGLTSIGDILDYVDHLSDLELHGLHLLPYDVKMGDSRLISLVYQLADKCPFPLWLYHNPKRGRSFTNQIIQEVKDHPNVGGIKIGGYNLTELTQTSMLRSETFEVIGAGGGQFFQMMTLGAHAHTTSDASAYPEPFVDLYKTYKSGNFEEAREKQFNLIRLSRQLPRTENGEYAAEEKYMLSLRGICGESVNPLYRKLTNDEKTKIRSILKASGFDWV